MMRSKTLFSLLLSFFCALTVLHGQVELKLQLQPDGKTYSVFARPQVDWVSPPANLTHSAQVTIVVPAGGFDVANLTSVNGTWQLATVVVQPPENPQADYLIFALVGATADISYKQNQEIELFRFENDLSGCPGPAELMDNDNDPFAEPNSQGIPAGNKLEIEGAGQGNNAFAGNYAPGSANCLYFTSCAVATRLTLLPDNYYQVAIVTSNNLPPVADPVGAMRFTVKVPSGMFRVHDLTNLIPDKMVFMGIHRYDAPIEAPGYDYIVFNLKANGLQDLVLQPGQEIPVLKFGNEGSCQGDSIYLLNNTTDPFLPPNSQNADVGQSVMLNGISNQYLSTCLDAAHAAPCTPCAFTPPLLKIDSISVAEPVVCLGGQNGIIRIHASGWSPVEYTIDGGQTWKSSPTFSGLKIGMYHPMVRSDYFGCEVTDDHGLLELEKDSFFVLKLDLPEKICAGSDVQLKVLSPQPLPQGSSYKWTGPAGFSSYVPDPVITGVTTFQSGLYSLTVNAPGCSPSSDEGSIEVVTPVEKPAIFAGTPICNGDTLILSTETQAAKYEWIGPLGTAPGVLNLPGMTTQTGETRLGRHHKSYLPGNWRVRVTDSNGCVVEGDPVPVNIKPRPQAYAGNDGPVCQGESVTLLSNPIPGVEYRWFRAGQNTLYSTQAYPVINNVITSETFYLEVLKDGCSSENLAVTTVKLHPKPSVLPQAQYTPAPDCAPQPLILQANHFGTANFFQWTGPNGFSSQLENPVIPNAVAAYNGSYLLQASNIWGCTAEEAFLVDNLVDPIDQPEITTAGPICPGETVELSVQDYVGSNVDYQWFLDGNPIPGATQSKLFIPEADSSDTGDYTVVVQVDQCTVESDPFYANLLNAPMANPDFFLSDPCEGGTLQLFSNASNAVSWQWTGPNGFSSQAPDPIIYDTQFSDVGAYTLTVTSVNGCTYSTSFVVDGILPVPQKPTVASNSPVCSDEEIILQVQNPPLIGTVHYEWINGNGVTLSASEATLTLPATDPLAVPPFFVKTYVNGCPSPLSEAIPVQVATAPNAEATNSGPVCPGEPVQLFAAPVPQGQYKWFVQGQNQAFSFEQNPVTSFQASTLVELHVSTQGCSQESVTLMMVPVLPKPEAATLPATTTYCSNESAILEAANTAPLAGMITYTWTGPPATGFSYTGTANANGPFSITIPNLTSSDEGAYTLVMTSEDGCKSDPISTFIDVVPTPQTPQLSVSSAILCQGETLELGASLYSSSNVTYDWYFDNGVVNYLLASTTTPSYFVPSVMASNTGTYTVQVTVDGCSSGVSNQAMISVVNSSTFVAIDNPTNVNTPACEGEDLELSVPFTPGATYTWYGPNGFSSPLAQVVLNDASASQSGEYFVVVELPGCNATATASTTVYIEPAPPLPQLVGPDTVCEGTDISISVANWVSGASYDFYFGTSLISSGPMSVLNFNDITPNQFGAYSVVAHIGNCYTEPSDYHWLFVDKLPPIEAYAGDDDVICPSDDMLFLEADPPDIGTGRWVPLTNATVVNESEAYTQAINLGSGDQAFAWVLSNGACKDYSADTVVFERSEPIQAFPDLYFLPHGEVLTGKKLLANDLIGPQQGVLFYLLDQPQKGTLQHLGDGEINYTPKPYAVGLEEFRYRICDVDCPGLCDTATVRINIKGPDSAADCFVPNLITPNGDGENETFFIPCIEAFPGSRLTIYNRYGNKIYDTENYQNDWQGTYKGKPLPDGTYFYQLTFNDDTRTAVQGYVVVLR
ncbi:MAG: hypothetical protein CMN32_02185 [Saprospirales bacterium]|nr:hypothetical protein [Saprospirales bacterium]